MGTGHTHNGRQISRMVAVISIGLLSGAMFEEYFVLRHAFAGLDGQGWGKAQAAFGIFHPWTIIPLAIVGTLSVFVAAALERPRKSARALITWGAAGISLVIGALTVLVMLPLNHEIEQWMQTGVPQNWTDIRDRWTSLQALRATLAVLGYIPLAIASHLPAAPQPGSVPPQ